MHSFNCHKLMRVRKERLHTIPAQTYGRTEGKLSYNTSKRIWGHERKYYIQDQHKLMGVQKEKLHSIPVPTGSKRRTMGGLVSAWGTHLDHKVSGGFFDHKQLLALVDPHPHEEASIFAGHGRAVCGVIEG